MVKRLRRRPLTAETGVRFPYELLTVLEQPNPKGCRKLRITWFAVFFIYADLHMEVCCFTACGTRGVQDNGEV